MKNALVGLVLLLGLSPAIAGCFPSGGNAEKSEQSEERESGTQAESRRENENDDEKSEKTKENRSEKEDDDDDEKSKERRSGKKEKDD
jgi:hypothetical protein